MNTIKEEALHILEKWSQDVNGTSRVSFSPSITREEIGLIDSLAITEALFSFEEKFGDTISKLTSEQQRMFFADLQKTVTAEEFCEVVATYITEEGSDK